MRFTVFLFVSMLFCGISASAQPKEAPVEAPVEPKQEVACVSQVDNSDLINKVEYLEKEIDKYRDDLALWLSVFLTAIAIIAGFLGVAFPMIYSGKAEKRLTDQVEKSVEKMDESRANVNKSIEDVKESIGNVNNSIKGFETEKATAIADLKNSSVSLLNEIQAEKNELTKLKVEITAMQEEFRVRGDRVIEEVREQTRVKADQFFSSKAASSIMETFAEGEKETKSNNTEENV